VQCSFLKLCNTATINGTSCSIWPILLIQFLDNYELDINVCNVNNIDSDHWDLIIVHLGIYIVCTTFHCWDRKKMTHQWHLHFANTAALLIRSPSIPHLVDLFDAYFICLVTLLLIMEHLFVKGVCYLSRKEHAIRKYDQ